MPEVFDEAQERNEAASPHLYALAPTSMKDVYKVGRSNDPHGAVQRSGTQGEGGDAGGGHMAS